MTDGLTGDKSGLRTVLAQEFSPADPVPGTVNAEQLPLLPLRQVGAPEADANSEPSARGVGRPPGSKNKSTAAWREFLLSKYPAPLIALAETYSRPLAVLAAELGWWDEVAKKVTAKPEQMLELLKVQLQCAKELAPYIHQRQPLAIDTGDKPLMQLIINAGGATQAQVDQAGNFSVNFIDAETESDQGLSLDDAQKSAASQSVAASQEADTIEVSPFATADHGSAGKGGRDA